MVWTASDFSPENEALLFCGVSGWIANEHELIECPTNYQFVVSVWASLSGC